MINKKVLYLITAFMLLILLGGNAWAQFLENWKFKPDGNENIINEYMATSGNTWVQNIGINATTGDIEGTFREWGFFMTNEHDGHEQYSFWDMSDPLNPNITGEVTAIFYAEGTLTLGQGITMTNGWLNVYYDDDLSNNVYGGDDYNTNDGIYYGANDGELIASFSLINGWGPIDPSGVPNGYITTIWSAQYLKDGVWLDSNENDLAELDPLYWNLGFGTTNASYIKNPKTKLLEELVEFAGDEAGISIDDVTNKPPYDMIFSNGGQFRLSQVPEPATMLLLGSGLIGFVGIGRKKFKRNKA